MWDNDTAWQTVWMDVQRSLCLHQSIPAICRDDLYALGTHLDIPTNMPHYKKGWTEYYIVNLIIFVGCFTVSEAQNMLF